MKIQSLLKATALTIAAVTMLSFAERPAPVKFKVDEKASTIGWIGKKVTGQHTGNVQIASGELSADKKSIKEGSFEIDMTTMTVTDVTDPNGNSRLLGHLKSDDFFGVEKFPKAKFVITSVTPKTGDEYTVKGNLTIKGITQSIEFPATIKNDGKKLTAVAKIVVDRTKYDIKYRSTNFFENLGDKAISNDFELDVNLVANAQSI